jgi:hypothetical protein
LTARHICTHRSQNRRGLYVWSPPTRWRIAGSSRMTTAASSAACSSAAVKAANISTAVVALATTAGRLLYCPRLCVHHTQYWKRYVARARTRSPCLAVEHVRFRCMQYCREKLLYTPSTTPLHQPYPVTRGLKSSPAIQPSTVYSSTALYSIQPLHHPSGFAAFSCGRHVRASIAAFFWR